MTQVAEHVTFTLGDAQVTMPVKAVVKAFLDSIAPASGTALDAPGARRLQLAAGELYADIILGKNGEPDYHLILMPGAAEDVNWEKAKEWAADGGGDLPTRREQSLLFANLGEEFQATWYWSSEQSESYSGYAWSQYFGNGVQDLCREGGEFRARRVRREPI